LQELNHEGERVEMSKPVEIGKTYKIHHSRKGNAVVQIVGICGEWIDCEVVTGELKGMGEGSLRVPGEELRVRECLATFVEVTGGTDQ